MPLLQLLALVRNQTCRQQSLAEQTLPYETPSLALWTNSTPSEPLWKEVGRSYQFTGSLLCVTLQCKQGLPRTNPCLRTSQHQCNVYIQFIYPPPPTQSSCEQISLQQSVNTVRGEASARFLMYNLPHPVQTPYLAFSISCSPVTQSERNKHTKSHSHRESYHTSTQRRERWGDTQQKVCKYFKNKYSNFHPFRRKVVKGTFPGWKK